MALTALKQWKLCHQIEAFSFLISLVTFDRVLSCRKSLSDLLQSTQLDLAGAADLVNATKETLQDYRIIVAIPCGIRSMTMLRGLQSFTVLMWQLLPQLGKRGLQSILKTQYSLNLQDHVRFCHLVKSTKGSLLPCLGCLSCRT